MLDLTSVAIGLVSAISSSIIAVVSMMKYYDYRTQRMRDEIIDIVRDEVRRQIYSDRMKDMISDAVDRSKRIDSLEKKIVVLSTALCHSDIIKDETICGRLLNGLG